MRIVFMGTPDFACQSLEQLCQSRHDVVAVVTGDDQPCGRGRKTQATPVCCAAIESGLPVIKAPSLKAKSLHNQLAELNPDVFVVVAFRILPQKLIDLPKLGAINIHASLLPKYRGAAPINWALINGETETGLTSFFLKKKVDTGDIILQQKITIEKHENFDSLHDRLSEMSGPFLQETLDLIEQENFTPIQQDESQATPAPKITPFDALIDFGFPAEKVVNFIRGMSSTPGAYTYYRDRKLKILSATTAEQSSEQPDKTRPGTIINTRKCLVIQCAGSAIVINELLPEGKKRMDAKSFINGFHPEEGEIMGEKKGDKELQ